MSDGQFWWGERPREPKLVRGSRGRSPHQPAERCGVKNLFAYFAYFAVNDLPMSLPYKIATLLYVFNERDEILLLERAQEPNRGLWSPCGGKLKMDLGESPYACACREAREEIGLEISAADLHLTGIVSEHGYQGQTHWLMFLFEVKVKLKSLPPTMSEGRFEFFPREKIFDLKIPQTDREQIWPWFWRFRAGFFAAHCHCHADGRNEWKLEESFVGDEVTSLNIQNRIKN